MAHINNLMSIHFPDQQELFQEFISLTQPCVTMNQETFSRFIARKGLVPEKTEAVFRYGRLSYYSIEFCVSAQLLFDVSVITPT